MSTIITNVRDVGTMITARRKSLKWTQSDLAKASGVGRRFVSDLENGKPTIEFQKSIRA